MKRFLLILSLFLFAGLAVRAQDGENDQMGKLQEKMKMYIQKRLNLTRNEADRFSPIFLRYIIELRQTHRDYLNDPPMRQLKVAEVRVRFRDEFKTVLDEPRANKVFEAQHDFENMVKKELMNRRMDNAPLRRNRSMIQ